VSYAVGYTERTLVCNLQWSGVTACARYRTSILMVLQLVLSSANTGSAIRLLWLQTSEAGATGPSYVHVSAHRQRSSFVLPAANTALPVAAG
jgi:hypothetical protein